MLSAQSQYSVLCIIGELHCPVTIFDGQAILSSDYLLAELYFYAVYAVL